MSHAVLVAAALGAWWSTAVPPGLLVGCVVVGALRRSRVALLVGVVLAVSLLGARAEAGRRPLPPGPVDTTVSLLTDPRPIGRGVLASARLDGHHVELRAFGRVAGRLDDALAGDQVQIVGSMRPVDDWRRWRHIVGSVSVREIGSIEAGAPLYRAANGLRRLLQRGAASLDRDDRALFTGMVIGDDREQSAVVADDFRAAGLGHVLVVSGQNVAFVLALVAPLTMRLRPGVRVLLVLLVLIGFLTVVRFEPSVLRAATMAGGGVAAAAVGSPTSGRRSLSWSVAGLLALDPFLVHVLAFQLSVAATAGLLWIAPLLRQRIPGPAWLVEPLALTSGAQLAVAPLLVVTFGSMPLAAIPANLVGAPIAGPIMIWGCTGGVVAGIAGGGIATAVHLPTRLLLWWIRTVAATAAIAPPAAVGGAALTLLAVGLGVAVHGRRTAVTALGAGVVMAVLVATVFVAPRPPSGWSTPTPGLRVGRFGPVEVLVLDRPPSPRRALEALREAGVGRPDLVVASSGGRADAELVVELRRRHGALLVFAPTDHRVPGGRSTRPGERFRIDEVVVTVEGRAPLTVRVDRVSP